MLYDIHEMKKAMMAPIGLMAASSRSLFANPFSPLSYAPGSERIAAGSELLARAVRTYDKPAWGIESVTVNGVDHALAENTAFETPFCKLVRLRRDGLPEDAQRVLLVAPMSGHHATLLRDTARKLVEDFEVFVTDWIDPRLVSMAHGTFHFDDYVTHVQEFIRHLGHGVHVVAVCQPTVPVLAAIALMAAAGEPDRPATMVLMGGPIDTRVSPTSVNAFAKSHSLRWFETRLITRVPTKYPGFMRRVYPGFLQHSGFVAMNPDRHLKAHVDFYNHLIEGDDDSADAHRRFYDEYNAVMDLDAAFYLETLDNVFLHHKLPEGELRVHGERVDPGAITATALMSIEGELDDICAPGQTEAVHELCRNIPAAQHHNLLVPRVGHYGIFSGRRWREQIYPQLRDFLEAHRADG
ncbi:polyhydroxyalkanoate depolymerase [Nitrogeniibacter mangrovi]|uniref:Polyhydroxyalkanoate depolymerase n=1 Tax=Nitrogeniibacter mangrovi TaxID=2016596 RepID=A0A6C1B5W3_9RHOO|nr:polyhydroxyalkanoate depolymerase [Nitrogeniibacter mangrovi]QID17690.1 polyhydroxyalkanoate depolymerase [Nitrogeniibacter mangrovi]